MRTNFPLFALALCLVIRLLPEATAATPGQAYHQTPACVDGNCVPNRGTNGYHATRWRPWPGGEPSYNKPVPPVGIDLKPVQVPARDKELELPLRPTAPGEGTSPEPSPNDQPGGGIVLPPELRNLTPAKPVEETRPGSSNLPRNLVPSVGNTGSAPQPLLIGKMPEPLRLRSAEGSESQTPSLQPPMLKIRPAGNTQSGLLPEMVPWNDEDKNPIVRQAVKINGSQVQQTLQLEESALPNVNENQTTIRIQQGKAPDQLTQTSAIASLPTEPSPRTIPIQERPQPQTWHASSANAPAVLPTVEARPLSLTSDVAPAAVSSPLRGVSQGNPLRP